MSKFEFKLVRSEASRSEVGESTIHTFQVLDGGCVVDEVYARDESDDIFSDPCRSKDLQSAFDEYISESWDLIRRQAKHNRDA